MLLPGESLLCQISLQPVVVMLLGVRQRGQPLLCEGGPAPAGQLWTSRCGTCRDMHASLQALPGCACTCSSDTGSAKLPAAAMPRASAPWNCRWAPSLGSKEPVTASPLQRHGTMTAKASQLLHTVVPGDRQGHHLSPAPHLCPRPARAHLSHGASRGSTWRVLCLVSSQSVALVCLDVQQPSRPSL